MNRHYVIYVRRSHKRLEDADVSDETQVERAKAALPAGSTYEVISDSGGHNSGRKENRDGYQELIQRVRSGRVQGIAVYDLSRLARDARVMLNLKHELDAQNVHLVASNLPGSTFDSAPGRFMFGQMCLAAQFQADLDSERQTAMHRRTFEDGGHRGNDPFGYRSTRDEQNRRQLVPVPEEAEVVKDIFRLLAQRSSTDVTDELNSRGISHRDGRPWSKQAVRDVWRRRRLYLGYVVYKRGLEERRGRHNPIIGEAEYTDAMAAVASRTHNGQPAKPHRTYALAGVLHCSCGAKMRGETRVSRGQEWRYYVCPVSRRRSTRTAPDGTIIRCEAETVPAEAAEGAVLNTIAGMILPQRVIDTARAEVRRRLRTPHASTHEKQRQRLQTRQANLRKQFEWGDIPEDEYRRKMADCERQLAILPSTDKVLLFDRNRQVMVSMAENVMKANPRQRKELVRMLVEHVAAEQRQVLVDTITWTPPARPFFKPAWLERPRRDAGTQYPNG